MGAPQQAWNAVENSSPYPEPPAASRTVAAQRPEGLNQENKKSNDYSGLCWHGGAFLTPASKAGKAYKRLFLGVKGNLPGEY
ncbi:MAG TPA: hypothetical protein VK997_06395 [Deferrisomatales bacterium]|nr:hypothetical protein [Deferrisomatales bacterium]